MKILVTGSNGFLGRNIKEHLELSYETHSPKRADLNLLDEKAVEEYLGAHVFDLVIHCAVKITALDENIRMFYILEKHSNLYGRMFSLGSGAEFSTTHYIPKMGEDYLGKNTPSDTYGLSKYVVARFIESSRKEIFNLRLFGIFGKYEDYTRRFISNNICRALAGLPISLNQNMFFDFLYINDFLKLLDMFIHKESLKYKTYNVCTGFAPDLLSIGEIIREATGSTQEILVASPGHKPEYSGNNRRLLSEINGFEFTPLKNSVFELHNWYKETEDSAIEAYIKSLQFGIQ